MSGYDKYTAANRGDDGNQGGYADGCGPVRGDLF